MIFFNIYNFSNTTYLNIILTLYIMYIYQINSNKYKILHYLLKNM